MGSTVSRRIKKSLTSSTQKRSNVMTKAASSPDNVDANGAGDQPVAEVVASDEANASLPAGAQGDQPTTDVDTNHVDGMEAGKERWVMDRDIARLAAGLLARKPDIVTHAADVETSNEQQHQQLQQQQQQQTEKNDEQNESDGDVAVSNRSEKSEPEMSGTTAAAAENCANDCDYVMGNCDADDADDRGPFDVEALNTSSTMFTYRVGYQLESLVSLPITRTSNDLSYGRPPSLLHQLDPETDKEAIEKLEIIAAAGVPINFSDPSILSRPKFTYSCSSDNCAIKDRNTHPSEAGSTFPSKASQEANRLNFAISCSSDSCAIADNSGKIRAAISSASTSNNSPTSKASSLDDNEPPHFSLTINPVPQVQISAAINNEQEQDTDAAPLVVLDLDLLADNPPSDKPDEDEYVTDQPDQQEPSAMDELPDDVIFRLKGASTLNDVDSGAERNEPDVMVIDVVAESNELEKYLLDDVDEHCVEPVADNCSPLEPDDGVGDVAGIWSSAISHEHQLKRNAVTNGNEKQRMETGDDGKISALTDSVTDDIYRKPIVTKLSTVEEITDDNNVNINNNYTIIGDDDKTSTAATSDVSPLTETTLAQALNSKAEISKSSEKLKNVQQKDSARSLSLPDEGLTKNQGPEETAAEATSNRESMTTEQCKQVESRNDQETPNSGHHDKVSDEFDKPTMTYQCSGGVCRLVASPRNNGKKYFNVSPTKSTSFTSSRSDTPTGSLDFRAAEKADDNVDTPRSTSSLPRSASSPRSANLGTGTVQCSGGVCRLVPDDKRSYSVAVSYPQPPDTAADAGKGMPSVDI